MIFLLYQQSQANSLEYGDDNKLSVVNCPSDFYGEVFIPRSVTSIFGYNASIYAFKKCKDSISSLRFEENSEITNISKYSFYNTSLRSANMSECKHLTLLDTSTFDSCFYLETVILPPNISSIGWLCFYKDIKLTSIDLPDSLVTLISSSFSESGLTTISVSPNSKLEKLDLYCFSSTKISSFFIPKSVKSLIAPFEDCSLKNVTVDSNNQNLKTDSKSLFSGKDNSTLVFVVQTFLGDYIVPDFVTKIDGKLN